MTGGERGRKEMRSAEWPAAPGETVVFLAESSTATERRVLDRWIEETRPDKTSSDQVDVIYLPHPRHDRAPRVEDILRPRLERGDDPMLAPLRVAWLPRHHNGEGNLGLSDLLAFEDPYNPSARRQEHIVRREPGRWRVILGEPARESELRKRWSDVTGKDALDGADFARFTSRQAILALERAESRLFGAHYKVPRLMREEIMATGRFRAGVSHLATQLGRNAPDVWTEAVTYLEEMVTGYGRLLIDATAQLGRRIIRQGYDPRIDYDEAQIEKVRAAVRRSPSMVLPTHRSNLDGLVMAVTLYENGLPRTLTIAGINMSFWPIGSIFRRAGSIFIRRDTTKLPVYRWVLREYIGFLMEKRFSVQIYLEGSRSRTGKMLPPKFGILRYVVDAYLDGRVEDIKLIPVSIAYDQLREVSEYVGEARGRQKSRETIGWMVRYTRQQRGRFGKIYVRFAEPVSVREALGPSGRDVDPNARRLALQKLAFEVSWRMNHVTPITATALLTMTLLGARDRALTLEQIMIARDFYLDDARRRGLPMTTSATQLDTEPGVRAALDSLIGQGVVKSYEGGPESVYIIGPDQHIAASFYRNSIIHFFLNEAISEVALARAVEEGDGDRLEAFWEETMSLRDLLKFEFFFEERDEYRETIAAELSLRDPEWQQRLKEGAESTRTLLESLRPIVAPVTLRSFVEAYGTVADALLRFTPQPEFDERAFIARCLALGRQYELQQRITSPESVSKPLFANGLQLARNRRLLEADEDVVERRRAFALELKDVLRRVDLIEEAALRHMKALLAERRA